MLLRSGFEYHYDPSPRAAGKGRRWNLSGVRSYRRYQNSLAGLSRPCQNRISDYKNTIRDQIKSSRSCMRRTVRWAQQGLARAFVPERNSGVTHERPAGVSRQHEFISFCDVTVMTPGKRRVQAWNPWSKWETVLYEDEWTLVDLNPWRPVFRDGSESHRMNCVCRVCHPITFSYPEHIRLWMLLKRKYPLSEIWRRGGSREARTACDCWYFGTRDYDMVIPCCVSFVRWLDRCCVEEARE